MSIMSHELKVGNVRNGGVEIILISQYRKTMWNVDMFYEISKPLW